MNMSYFSNFAAPSSSTNLKKQYHLHLFDQPPIHSSEGSINIESVAYLPHYRFSRPRRRGGPSLLVPRVASAPLSSP